MNTNDFMNLSSEERVNLVNGLLKKEQVNHLQNVAKKLGMTPSTFSKIMRDHDNFQYNQSKKQYYKLMSMEEYQQMAQHVDNATYDDSLQFLNDNLDKLKKLLDESSTQLIINPKIYSVDSKTNTKTVQVNAEIYEQFQQLAADKFPHLRLRELFSQSLLDFTEKYKE
ncbi:hypothetical protein ACS127_05585 [Amphibacillus sp. Q70]|uniref:hypothetical protein n=1 Tax=Amphibacillus sp. Q70 TaxID=3453416 RepID=UPI003F84503D